MEKIFTGMDRARELKFRTFREFLFALMKKKGFVWSGMISDATVQARVDFGRWIADCECGGAAYVEPTDPVYMCTSCGNQSHGGDFLTVVFPDDMEAIEEELLNRPVLTRPGNQPTQAALMSVAVLPLTPRNWLPGETVGVLRRQRRNAILARGKLT